MTFLIAFTAFQTAALLYMLHRAGERRQRDRLNELRDMEAMIGLVERLCQRIQAPSVAVQDHSLAAVSTETPMVVPLFDDDDAYWHAGESKDALAERLMREELEARRAPAGVE